MMPRARMRVCHIASGDLWAGAEVQIAGLLGELKTFSDLEVTAILLNKGRLHDELLSKGIRVVVYDETRLNFLQIFSALRANLREQRPHVLHTHRYKENILTGIAAKLSSVPFTVRTVHGLQENLRGWQRTKMSVYLWLEGMVAQWTRQYTVGVSEEIATIMRQRLPRNTVVCIHNGIDVENVRPSIDRVTKRRELGIPDEAIVVGTVSRLVPVKGIEYLLRAIGRLCEELPETAVRLLLVGEGPSRSKLEALTCELGIERKTLFLGHRSDVYDLMNLFDIFALPSLHEGMPMALLEAMALGRPVVASRVGGIPEVVTDGAEGRLVPAQDIHCLSRALRELALSRTLREQLGRAAKERILRSFERKHMAAEVRELYWSLVERGDSISNGHRVIGEDTRNDCGVSPNLRRIDLP